MALAPVRIAAVGCGYWGPNVIRNLAELDSFDLCCICDSQPDRLQCIAARYPGVRTTTRIDDILADPDIEAVYLATPVSTHYDLTRGVLESDKHVLVEKPLATTVDEGEALAALATSRGLTLLVGHTFLFSPPVRTVRSIIEQGRVGPIYYVETTRVNLGLFQKDVSVLWDLGPHDVSMLIYWLDEVPSEVSARGRSYAGEALEDVVFMTLVFPSGILAQVQLSWLAPSKLRRTSIVGRQRMIIYDDLAPVEKVKIFDRGIDRQPQSFGEFQLTYRSGDVLSPRIESTEPLLIECQHFFGCIRQAVPPLADATSAIEVIRVLQAAERSLHHGGVPQPVLSPGIHRH